MTIDQLIKLTENRLLYLQGARSAAWASGDVMGVDQTDEQIAETQLTLDQLKTLV